MSRPTPAWASGVKDDMSAANQPTQPGVWREMTEQEWLRAMMPKIAPIKIVTICVDQERGRYMAMFANDAMKRAVAGSPEEATYALLVQEKVITVEDGDVR
tara:strand:+ start:202 stop:504 length:303 start_codon:yes stop_codon:yes gene_type:complete